MSLQPDVIEAPQAAQMVVAEPSAVAVTPMAMLQLAVEKGANVEQLERLMALQERWEKNEARKAFAVALVAFKADPPEVLKKVAVSFGADAKKTAYKHAALDDASSIIGAHLSKFNLAHRWDYARTESNNIKVTCILTHVLGHSESVYMDAPADTSGSKNPVQAIASTTSYLERYTLFMVCGVAPKNVDDDGRGGVGAHEMDSRVKSEFSASIAALADRKAAEVLWQHIAQECTKVGDVAAYAELKTALAAKVKSLGAAAKDAI